MERPALTALGEEESLFRATVRAFAERLRPLAAEMDREGKLRPEVISWLFELGLMGIEIPESWGASRSRNSRASILRRGLRRAEHARHQRGEEVRKLARAAARPVRDGSVGPTRSPSGSGSDAFALACRAERARDPSSCAAKLWITNGERSGVLVFATVDRRRLQGHHLFRGERDSPVSRPQGRQARHPRVEHLRADLRRRRRARTCSAPSARATRSRSRRERRCLGIAAQRRLGRAPTRSRSPTSSSASSRGADGRARAGRVRHARSRTCARERFGQQDRRVPGGARLARSPSRRGRAPARLQRRATARRRPASCLRWRSGSRATSPSASSEISNSTAASASRRNAPPRNSCATQDRDLRRHSFGIDTIAKSLF